MCKKKIILVTQAAESFSFAFESYKKDFQDDKNNKMKRLTLMSHHGVDVSKIKTGERIIIQEGRFHTALLDGKSKWMEMQIVRAVLKKQLSEDVFKHTRIVWIDDQFHASYESGKLVTKEHFPTLHAALNWVLQLQTIYICMYVFVFFHIYIYICFLFYFIYIYRYIHIFLLHNVSIYIYMLSFVYIYICEHIDIYIYIHKPRGQVKHTSKAEEDRATIYICIYIYIYL